MRTCVFFFPLLLVLLFTSTTHIHAATNGPLRKSSNPSYFMDASGKAVYLSGQHTWWNFYSSQANLAPNGNFASYYSDISSKGQNFVRLWSGDAPEKSLEPHNGWGRGTANGPYASSPTLWNWGSPVTCCNQAFIQRLKDAVASAKSYNLYVSVMLFQGWWQGDPPPDWGTALNQYHAFNAIDADSGNWYTMNNSTIYNLEKNYVSQVVNALKGYDNVMYEICNECHNTYRSANTAWQKALVDYIHGLDPTKVVGFTGNADSNSNTSMLTSNADWVSLEGSEYLEPIEADPRKISILDTDHVQCANTGCATDDAWVWKAFTRGHNPILMDDWGTQGIRNVIGSAISALGPTVWMANTRVQNLASMRPNATPCNTSYCLGNGNEMVAYYPSGTSNPNLGSGWNYESYSTTSTSPGSGNQVIYAFTSGTSPAPSFTPSPTPKPSLINILRAYLTSASTYDLNDDKLVTILDFALASKN